MREHHDHSFLSMRHSGTSDRGARAGLLGGHCCYLLLRRVYRVTFLWGVFLFCYWYVLLLICRLSGMHYRCDLHVVQQNTSFSEILSDAFSPGLVRTLVTRFENEEQMKNTHILRLRPLTFECVMMRRRCA